MELTKGQKQTHDELVEVIEETNARLLALPEGTFIGVNDGTDVPLKHKSKEAAVTIIGEAVHSNDLTYIKVSVGENCFVRMLESDQVPGGLMGESPDSHLGNLFSVEDIKRLLEDYCERWEVLLETSL